MAMGRLHIFQLETHPGKYGETLREFQVDYTSTGNTFTGVMGEEKLREFLSTKAAISPDKLEPALAELRDRGQLTLSDIEIPEGEAASLGLVQEPSDY